VLPSSGEIQSTIGIFSLADNEIMNEWMVESCRIVSINDETSKPLYYLPCTREILAPVQGDERHRVAYINDETSKPLYYIPRKETRKIILHCWRLYWFMIYGNNFVEIDTVHLTMVRDTEYNYWRGTGQAI
jgi:hypothetical protein